MNTDLNLVGYMSYDYKMILNYSLALADVTRL